ncbi:alanine--tRNA ligase [Desulfobotulus sp. H1]|uniref:Alanine--tRNA ligase n=1 Tax=Desulfobotulus pelophilus TaxID=2823377 RepID=A0ABT3NCS2_9BACT|nr:alanine--tRNA ligase [Desulfobotulus pelophilus]MCW7755263.1 alanine--tRNA ligase [Desulfobotulus pelophilus]
MTGNEIRQKFLEYFKKYEHRLVRSSSLVPSDDPTLLFTNAGMVQFKRVFIGEEKREYTTATTSQKCVRAGGKHNDLENVGYTARHHTFFEMLGNFSFGDYFKEKAIFFAWDLLTNGYGLPAEKLWVSIYLDDDEAFTIWHEQIGVPKERIVRLGEADNFWAMGDTGPCGPCSEIHIDRGPAYGCDNPACAVGCDCDRYLEIWNLVFMQFNRSEDGSMTPLPKPSIDTGMGLERIASVVQGVDTNYDTDLFVPIMEKVGEMSGKKPGEDSASDVAMKVIADHSRAAAFLVNDGVLPSNEGRGYVLRRILRRAIRYGRNIGLTRPFLKDTVRVVFSIMEEAYPELKSQESFICSVIENEEIRFSETLDNGLKLLHETLEGLAAAGKKELSGDVIFRLYDTYGFPVDIVKDVTKGSDVRLDIQGFDTIMAERREMSRSKVKFDAMNEAYLSLSSAGVQTVFTGYERTEDKGKVFLLVQQGKACDRIEGEGDLELVTDRTPFYAESGGQAGDRGFIRTKSFEMKVTDTLKDPTGFFIHKGKIVSGSLAKGEEVILSVDSAARAGTERNHTATHLLHAALRDVVGDHVKQSGSLVGPDRLRFDFTHFSGIDRSVLDTVERWVNEKIRENVPVNSEVMQAEEAFKTGATALFEEKYGDEVRVISLDTFSKEFCGGTHTAYTGDIGLFVIVSEGSVAAGVRRIEALTGASALAFVQERNRIMLEAASLLKDRPETLVTRVERLLADCRSQEKTIDSLKNKMAEMSAGDITEGVVEIQGVKVLAKKVMVDNPASLRDLADRMKDKLGSGIVLLGTESDGKVLLIAVVSKDLVGRFHAGNIVKAAAGVVGGGGGGRSDMAQAGGTRPENLDAALQTVLDMVAQA